MNKFTSNENTPANLILYNGKIYTVDKQKSWKEAIVVKDENILFTGNSNEALQYKSNVTKMIDLEGKMLLPGFVDAHMHPLMTADLYMNQIALSENQNKDSLLKTIKDFTSSHPNQEVIRGGGFNRAVFDEQGPQKEWLDSIEIERPVYIVSVDGHSAWVNSSALTLGSITKNTPQPGGGKIMMDSITGEPSGLLQEKGAMELVSRRLPTISKQRYKKDIMYLENLFGKTGITTVFDAYMPLDEENYWMAYKECAEENKLTWRYRGGWYLNPAKDLKSEIEKGFKLSKIVNSTPYFQVNAFKFFLDQVAEEKTSYMLKPFEGEIEYRGFKNFEDEQLLDAFVQLDKKGFQIHCHQIGDAAAQYGLDALEKLEKINGKKDRRPAFAHCQWVSEADKKRMASLGISSILSAYWMSTDDYYWDIYLPYLGKDRVNNMYPVKSLFNLGINMAVHSDFFVSEPDPMYAIYSGITRNIPKRIFNERYSENSSYTRTTIEKERYTKNVIGPLPPFNEKATLEDMIYAFTMGGATSMFMEKEIGSLEPGKKADMVVLSENLFDIETENIPDVKIEMVFFEGKQTY